MLPVKGQNDVYADKLAITNTEYQCFIDRNKSVCRPEIEIIPESNEIMTGSYAMIDPQGRFFDNVEGKHTYSEQILKVGIDVAFSQVNRSEEKYLTRKGDYFEKLFV
jgi:radical S-adenosyl methionine domain-containing protein 2